MLINVIRFFHPDHFFAAYACGTWGAIASAAVSVGGSMLSSSINKQNAAPAIPYQNVDPTQVQQNAIAGDIATLPQAQQLAGATNTSNLQTAISNLNTALPGYSGLQQDLMSKYTAQAQNPYALPADALAQIKQQGAEANIMGGTGSGSGFSQNNALRSLGVNIMQYGQQNLSSALQGLSALTGTAPNVSPVSPLSFMLTPSQALSTVTNNNTNNQQIAQGGANAQTAAANQNSQNLFDQLTSSGAISQVGGLLNSGVNYLTTPSAGSGGGSLSGMGAGV